MSVISKEGLGRGGGRDLFLSEFLSDQDNYTVSTCFKIEFRLNCGWLEVPAFWNYKFG